MRSLPGRASVLLSTLLLAGCAGLALERGRADVGAQLAERIGREVALAEPGSGEIDQSIRALIEAPLSADTAVEIAWRLSPRTKAALAGLGLAAADLFEAQRPHNPGLSIARLNGEHRETAFELHVALTELLTLPSRRRIGEAEWRAAVAETVDTLLDEAAAVRRAYHEYVAAEQIMAMRDAVAEAAALSAEMARRFHAAGNISALQLAREQAHASEARSEALAARVERLASRMELAERLGLAGRSNRWRVPEQLPLPYPDMPATDAVLERAHAQRADLAAAQAALEAHGISAELARRIGWLGEVELGVEHEREGGERRSGPGLAFELPLFRQGQHTVARADARREQALQHAVALQLAIQNEVRVGAARLAAQREIVEEYRRALIPSHEAIVAREQERYNFMLIGVFELLEARRQEFDAWQHYYEAIRDFWLADVALERAAGGALPRAPHAPEFAPRAQDVIAPAPADGHHHHH